MWDALHVIEVAPNLHFFFMENTDTGMSFSFFPIKLNCMYFSVNYAIGPSLNLEFA
jgi:hypothetical protein